MKPEYYSIEDMLIVIPEPNRTGCFKLLESNRKLFQTVQGSTNNHQNWVGGYHDHIQEIMNVSVVLYRSMNVVRPLPFKLTDALLVTYLHDVEKPWKYEIGFDGQLREVAAMRDKAAQIEFRMQVLKSYEIVFTSEQENAMRYVEGEGKDYSNRQRIAGPLAAFCHMCDVASARIWFNHPSAANDPWSGASRIRT